MKSAGAAALTILLTAMAIVIPGTAAQSAEIRFGVIAPAEGTFAPLGEQIRNGVRAFAAAEPSGVVTLVSAPERCDEEDGAAAAEAMVEADVGAVIGFMCPERLIAGLPVLSQAGIVTMTVSVRAGIIMEEALKHGWPFFRLAPADEHEIARIVDVIARRWSGRPFALVEDGTIYGRELAEAVRVRLEERGIAPAFIDNFRPAQDEQLGLAHRLRRAGVSHVFVGGERSDVAVIVRDATALGLDLTFLGGGALKAADGDVPLPDGVFAVTMPDPQDLPTAERAKSALAALGAEPHGYSILAFAAAEILSQALAAEQPAAEVLVNRRFSTVVGPIAFDGNHERADNPFQLTVWRDGTFVDPDTSAGN